VLEGESDLRVLVVDDAPAVVEPVTVGLVRR